VALCRDFDSKVDVSINTTTILCMRMYSLSSCCNIAPVHPDHTTTCTMADSYSSASIHPTKHQSMVLAAGSTFSKEEFDLDYSDIATVQDSTNGGSLSVVAWTLPPRRQVYVTMTRHGAYKEKVRVQSTVSESQAVDLIKAAAYKTIDDPAQKLALFEAVEAFEKPKPSEYTLKPSTYGQEDPAQT
jgi:hypothetical protein